MRVSIVTPAFNEAANLPLLYEHLKSVLASVTSDWEWVVVDDHSSDGTFNVLGELAAADRRVLGIQLARRSGSHTAITCALHHATGDCATMLAADLQDPPALVGTLVDEWRKGVQIVWAARAAGGTNPTDSWFSRAYYFVMRRIVGLKTMPAAGADCFLVDRAVLDAFRRFPERNTSVFALLTWMGFRQTTVVYTKKPRAHGASGWSFGRKITLLVDSVSSFSLFPVRALTSVGAVLFLIGTVLGIAGGSLILAAVLAVGGLQLVMMGVVGEYLWRALDESRGRPRYLIQATTQRS